MAEAPGTLEGWYALHDFRRVVSSALSPDVCAEIAESAESYVREAESLTDGEQGASAAYRILGHKADFLFLHLRATMEELARLEQKLDSTPFGAASSKPYSYLSAVELSL